MGIFCEFWNINCALEIIWRCSGLNTMASAPPCPARSLDGGHPLRPPLLFHLCLHPHCHLPPPGCVSCCWAYQTHPGQGAHCLCSHSTRWDKASILTDNGPKKMFRLLSSSWSANVGNSCLCTSLDQSMEIFRALAPIADHVSLQLAEWLQSPDEWAHLTNWGPMVQPVQPLQRSPVGAWELSCPPWW